MQTLLMATPPLTASVLCNVGETVIIGDLCDNNIDTLKYSDVKVLHLCIGFFLCKGSIAVQVLLAFHLLDEKQSINTEL